MHILKLIFKNMLRHKLRSFLTVLGIAIAVMAFGLMRTVISSWNSGVEASAANRLVTVHAVSFIYPLPLSYQDQIAKVPGVRKVSFANWFQGIYKDKDQFFARFAVDPDNFFDLYPEVVVSPKEKEAMKNQRNGCIIGAKIARTYNLKIGDLMNIDGDIYPGQWQMQVVGIYHGRDETSDETWMLFNWHYLDEGLKQASPGRAGQVGWYIVDIGDPNQRAAISAAIDNLFTNSPAETKTQTEKEFNQSFVSMSGAILTAIDVVSFVIIGIILMILMNTMVMTARERIREYAVLKTLGFSSSHLVSLIGGESLLISSIGGALGVAITFPITSGIHKVVPPQWFPVFNLETMTVVLAAASALLAGVLAAAFPATRAVQTKIVDGLRQIG
ncbi:MAG: ABC transporter permease [Ignavibacteria bacterium]|nr:ABC transporter permease [Ignavibacteria bacterium]MBI3766100.1 ABC transporter permease [Ignavibacteriales bacterium]